MTSGFQISLTSTTSLLSLSLPEFQKHRVPPGKLVLYSQLFIFTDTDLDEVFTLVSLNKQVRRVVYAVLN